jgi:hypothetical protein
MQGARARSCGRDRERCATCGGCRCDRHTYCGPAVPAVVRAAAVALTPAHTPAIINAYGACTVQNTP